MAYTQHTKYDKRHYIGRVGGAGGESFGPGDVRNELSLPKKQRCGGSFHILEFYGLYIKTHLIDLGLLKVRHKGVRFMRRDLAELNVDEG